MHETNLVNLPERRGRELCGTMEVHRRLHLARQQQGRPRQALPGRWQDLGNGQAEISSTAAGGGSSPLLVHSWAPDKLVIQKERDESAAGS
jgi:hypothetical protein